MWFMVVVNHGLLNPMSMIYDGSWQNDLSLNRIEIRIHIFVKILPYEWDGFLFEPFYAYCQA